MYQPSYWERESVFKGIDFCIIGSGIVGLTTAIYLNREAPSAKVLVVDSGFLPYGASTRNAGFACFGSMTELLDDLDKEPEEDVFERVMLRYNGLQELRKLVGDNVMGYEHLGGYELFTENDIAEFENCITAMNRFNKALATVTGLSETYLVVDKKIAEFGFSNVKHMIQNAGEGQIDTGKMMKALQRICYNSGTTVINGLSIREINSENNGVTIRCANGFSFTASKVLVASNGFAKSLLPQLEVSPGRAQAFITQPVDKLPFTGCFHHHKGFNYFRNVNNRVLIGGGRHLDMKGEETTAFGVTGNIQDYLIGLLREMVLPETRFEIDLTWSGIMGLGPVRKPIVQQTGPGIYCAVRMGGMGIAIGSTIGKQAAGMLINS